MRRTTISTALGLLVIAVLTTQITAQRRGKPNPRLSAAVRAVLDAQRDAWNRGDIAGYMDGYDRSPETVFVSGDSVTHGWQTVLERYQKNYSSREKMGTLTFSDLEIAPLGKDGAVVIGSGICNARMMNRMAGSHFSFARQSKAGRSFMTTRPRRS